jgi:hypothetical protein
LHEEGGKTTKNEKGFTLKISNRKRHTEENQMKNQKAVEKQLHKSHPDLEALKREK